LETTGNRNRVELGRLPIQPRRDLRAPGAPPESGRTTRGDLRQPGSTCQPCSLSSLSSLSFPAASERWTSGVHGSRSPACAAGPPWRGRAASSTLGASGMASGRLNGVFAA